VVLPAGAPETSSVVALLRGAGWRDDLLGEPGFVIVTGGAAPARVAPGRPEAPLGPGARAAPSGELRLELDEPVEVGGAELMPGPGHPVWLGEVAVEIRGEAGWVRVPSTVRTLGPLAWAGTHVLRMGLQRIEYRFPPVRARALRLVRAGAADGASWPGATLRALRP
jgi:hypothetical protein